MHNLFIITASKQIEWCRIQVSTFLSVVKLCISSQINCGFSRSPENKVFAAEAVVKLGSCSAPTNCGTGTHWQWCNIAMFSTENIDPPRSANPSQLDNYPSTAYVSWLAGFRKIWYGSSWRRPSFILQCSMNNLRMRPAWFHIKEVWPIWVFWFFSPSLS